MTTPSKIPWNKLKADTLRAICRDLGTNPGKRKREMLEFLRAAETAGLDEALKVNIEDKEDSSPCHPPAKRARAAEEQQLEPANGALLADSVLEGDQWSWSASWTVTSPTSLTSLSSISITEDEDEDMMISMIMMANKKYGLQVAKHWHKRAKYERAAAMAQIEVEKERSKQEECMLILQHQREREKEVHELQVLRLQLAAQLESAIKNGV